METSYSSGGARTAWRGCLIDQEGVSVVYPEPRRMPVLPPGWAPLTRDQQDVVLRACDAAPGSLVFKIGSLWDPASEYRVYRLADEQWAGLSVVSKCMVPDSEALRSGTDLTCNGQLLGLAGELLGALRIAADFFNRDLETHGQSWRLGVHDAHVEHS